MRTALSRPVARRYRLSSLFGSIRHASAGGGFEWVNSLVNYEKDGLPDGAGSLDGDNGWDLAPMRQLLDALGSPQKGLRTVHVAGTKGKGSTVAFLENILLQSGYKVGAFTSPKVRSVGELFRVDGREASEVALDRLLTWVRARVEAESLNPTYFEVMTALAFKHFQEEGVDVAIMEAGLGAARDATNALDSESLDLGVVTSIGPEHLEALGGSLESIAKAKAAVFKEGKVGVVGVQENTTAEAVVLLEASERRVKTYRVENVVGYHVEDEHARLEESPDGLVVKNTVSFQLPGELVHACFGARDISEGQDNWEFDSRLSLVGRHQASNAATAIASALALKADAGYELISKSSIQAGLELTTLPGRFQVIDAMYLDGEASKQVLTIIDGAHTRASAKSIVDTVRQLFPNSKLAVVMAMASDKDHEGFCSEIQRALPSVVVFTETHIGGGHARSVSPGALVSAWQVAKMKNKDIDRTWRCRELIQANVQSALSKARHELSGEAPSEDAPLGVILACGSLSMCNACTM